MAKKRKRSAIDSVRARLLCLPVPVLSHTAPTAWNPVDPFFSTLHVSRSDWMEPLISTKTGMTGMKDEVSSSPCSCTCMSFSSLTTLTYVADKYSHSRDSMNTKHHTQFFGNKPSGFYSYRCPGLACSLYPLDLKGDYPDTQIQ